MRKVSTGWLKRTLLNLGVEAHILEVEISLEELISDANTSRVAFYPVGASDAPRFSDASSRGLPAQARGAAVSADSRANDGLQWLANRSGGRSAFPRPGPSRTLAS